MNFRDLPCRFTLWEEQMRIKHYIDVIAAAQTYGVDAVKWSPDRKQSVPHSGEDSRDSVPPGHNYESDDDFALPLFGAQVPKRGQLPGSID
jgi:hypothetical protein